MTQVYSDWVGIDSIPSHLYSIKAQMQKLYLAQYCEASTFSQFGSDLNTSPRFLPSRGWVWVQEPYCHPLGQTPAWMVVCSPNQVLQVWNPPPQISNCASCVTYDFVTDSTLEI